MECVEFVIDCVRYFFSVNYIQVYIYKYFTSLGPGIPLVEVSSFEEILSVGVISSKRICKSGLELPFSLSSLYGKGATT